jgi:hypothetical protein
MTSYGQKEELADEELDRIRAAYTRLAAQARADFRRGLRDTGVPDVAEPDTPYGQNIRTHLPTGHYASISAYAAACLTLPSDPYSA